jgi:signal peptidase
VSDVALVGRSRGSALLPVARRSLRLAATLVTWTVAGFCTGILLVATAPRVAGLEVLTVLSGSMAPALQPGDVIVDSRIAPATARPGDIVTFRDPHDGTRLITHRVRTVEVRQRTVRFVTKGDASTDVERWSVARDGTIGRVEYRVPHMARVLGVIQERTLRILLVLVPALLLGLLELGRIWGAQEETR